MGTAAAPVHPPPDGPRSPFAAGLAVTAAAVLGVALVLALAASGSPGLGLVWGLVLAALGAGVAVLSLWPGPVRDVVGRPTLAAGGTALAAAGAYAVGIAVFALLIEGGTIPSSAVIVLLLQGLPGLALAGAAALLGQGGTRVAAAYVGAVVVMSAIRLAGLDPTPLGLLGLVLGAAGLWVVLVTGPRSAAGGVAAIVAAVVASFAISPVGPALSGTGSVTPTRGSGAFPGETMLVVLLVAGLVLASAVAAAAVVRRHAGGATVAGAVLLSPILSTASAFVVVPGDGARTVVLVLPLLVLVAATALAVPAARVRVLGVLPPGAARRAEVLAPATAGTVAGLTLVFLAVHPAAVSTWNARLLAVVAFALLGAAAALALRRDDAPGRILAGTVLVGLALVAPWGHLVHGGIGLVVVDPRDPGITALLGLLVGGAAIAVLVGRHPHPGVVAAATLLGLRIAADAVGALVLSGYGRPGPVDLGLEGGALVMAFLPIGAALLGAALVAAIGGRAAAGHAHAVGAVATLATVAAAAQMGSTFEVRTAIGQAVGPFAPTVGQAFPRVEFGTSAIVVLVPVMLAAIALAASAVRRWSPAAAGGSAAAVLATAVAVSDAADGGVEPVVPIVVGIIGALLAGIALFAVAVAPGIRDRR